MLEYNYKEIYNNININKQNLNKIFDWLLLMRVLAFYTCTLLCTKLFKQNSIAFTAFQVMSFSKKPPKGSAIMGSIYLVLISNTNITNKSNCSFLIKYIRTVIQYDTKIGFNLKTLFIATICIRY